MRMSLLRALELISGLVRKLIKRTTRHDMASEFGSGQLYVAVNGQHGMILYFDS